MSSKRKAKDAKSKTVMDRSKIKTENLNLGENDATPVRDEQYVNCPSPSQDNVGNNLDTAGWESDSENNTGLPPVPVCDQFESVETSLTNELVNSIKITKPEPYNDNCPTPFRNTGNSPASDPAASTEFSAKPKVEKEEYDNLPSDYFDSLIENGISGLPNAISKTVSMDQLNLCSLNEATKDLPQVNLDSSPQQTDEENRLAAQIKIRCDELAKLEEEMTVKKRKKHKKGKRHHTNDNTNDEGNRKRQRSRSRSQDHKSRKKERKRGGHSPIIYSEENHEKQYSTSNMVHGIPRISKVKVEDSNNEQNLSVKQCERTIKTINLSKLMEKPAPLPTAPLTVKDKRKLAVERVTALLNLMRLKASKAPDAEFLAVDTIRKLPSSTSFMKQGIFENPSPICNNYNVHYRFNSIAGTRFNLAKWGLEAMPTVTTQLLRLTGIDVERLKQLQLNTKMSHRMLKLKDEAAAKASTRQIDDYVTSLYANAGTQTDRRLCMRTRDMGVQVLLELGGSRCNGSFWQDSNFNETDISQQQANVMYALRELSTTMPSSIWADALFKALGPALAIKRAAERRSYNF